MTKEINWGWSWTCPLWYKGVTGWKNPEIPAEHFKLVTPDGLSHYVENEELCIKHALEGYKGFEGINDGGNLCPIHKQILALHNPEMGKGLPLSHWKADEHNNARIIAGHYKDAQFIQAYKKIKGYETDK